MEPVSMILAALASGAAAAAQDTASQAIRDRYTGVKSVVQKKLQARQANAPTVIAEFEKDSETWEKPMQKSLADAGAASDDEVIELARRVLQLVQTDQGPGKFNVQVTGNVQGQIVGDRATQKNVFG